MVRNRLRIIPFACGPYSARVEVRCENLKTDRAFGQRNLFEENHDERIDFFAGTASHAPYPDRNTGLRLRDDLRHDPLTERVERFGVTEKIRDVDQNILCQSLNFCGVVLQQSQILIHVPGFDRRHRHAPLNPALQGAVLVEREVIGAVRTQEFDDLRQEVRAVFGRRFAVPLKPRFAAQPMVIGDQGTGNVGDRKHAIDQTRCNGAPWHSVEASVIGFLSDDEAATLFDGPKSDAAVGSVAGEHNANRSLSDLPGERLQQDIEEQSRPLSLDRRDGLKQAAIQRQGYTRWNDVNRIWFDRHTLGRLAHRHLRMPGKELGDQTVMRGVQVLDENESHAGVGGHGVEKFPKHVQSPGGRADADDCDPARDPVCPVPRTPLLAPE